MDKFPQFFIIFIIGIFIGYFWGTSSAQSSINELNELEVKHEALNNTYNQLKVEYQKTSAESQEWKNKYNQLQKETADILIEDYIAQETIWAIIAKPELRLICGALKIYASEFKDVPC